MGCVRYGATLFSDQHQQLAFIVFLVRPNREPFMSFMLLLDVIVPRNSVALERRPPGKHWSRVDQ